MTTPINPPQPSGGEYSLTALMPSYIREFTNQAGYTSVTGKTPPAYNPAAPIKTWDDTRKFTNLSNPVNYTMAELDASKQHPVIVAITLPAFIAVTVNIPPDSGPTSPNTAGSYPFPIRPLLPNERLLGLEGGLIDVINTDIFDPDPTATIKAMCQRILAILEGK